MYKVLLVDDEVLILNGLKNLIQWDELEMVIEDTALNGEEAYEKFINNPVDIVITDITMPKLNGLQLIRKIKEINSETKFIILSGYDDFNYAKEGISLGIENYILKPINEEELEATLDNTIKKLESSIKKPLTEAVNLEILKENILYRWASDSISNYELEERSFVLGIDLFYENYIVAIIKIKENLKENNEMYFKIYNKVKSYEEELNSSAVFHDLEGDIAIIYGSNDEALAYHNMKAASDKLLKSLREEFSLNFFITLGSIEKSYKDVYKSYFSAKELQKYILSSGYNKIVSVEHISEIEKQNTYSSNFDVQEFRRLILSKDVKSINAYIDYTYEQLFKKGTVKPEELQNIAIKMMLVLKRTLKELNFSTEGEDENLKELIFEVCNLRTMEQLTGALKTKCEELIEKLKNNYNSVSPVIQQILNYINQNFKEEISLKTLSFKYNVNPSYLGQIFHKEVGMAFSDYLNKVKNEKAKELLLNTNLKVNDIAKMVGYVDTSYFYRRFKEYFGISPSTLRGSKSY